MIFGIGSDLLEIDRVMHAETHSQGRFSKRILGVEEYIVYSKYRKKSDFFAFSYLAKRFSAKEAFSKAIGSGMRPPIRWRDIQILSDVLGKPFMVFDGEVDFFVKKKI